MIVENKKVRPGAEWISHGLTAVGKKCKEENDKVSDWKRNSYV